MPAIRLPWLKLWPESMAHEKIAMLSDELGWAWIKCLCAASQQRVRWHFASVEHAAAVTGRTVAQIEALIERTLLDQTGDGLWIHDYTDWQERYPSDVGRPTRQASDDRSAENEATLREYSGKAPRILRQGSANTALRREKREERRERGEGRGEVVSGTTGEEESVAVAPARPRPADAIWDALVTIFGAPRTPQERAKRNAAVAQVRQGACQDGLSDGDAAAAVLKAHSRWVTVMERATETPHGLVSNLGLLLDGPQVHGREDGRPTRPLRGAAVVLARLRSGQPGGSVGVAPPPPGVISSADRHALTEGGSDVD